MYGIEYTFDLVYPCLDAFQDFGCQLSEFSNQCSHCRDFSELQPTHQKVPKVERLFLVITYSNPQFATLSGLFYSRLWLNQSSTD